MTAIDCIECRRRQGRYRLCRDHFDEFLGWLAAGPDRLVTWRKSRKAESESLRLESWYWRHRAYRDHFIRLWAAGRSPQEAANILITRLDREAA